MRTHRFLAAAAGLLAACAPALAQSFPAEAVIVQPEVLVRSGPSKQFFETSKLKQNDKVLVLRESKEAPGWLEIVPPAGSFSWINSKNVKQIESAQGYVICDPSRPAPILPGSRLVDQPPNRESMKLTQGTIVVILRQLKVGDETWLQILPHGNEVRFIPTEAVRAATVVSTTSAPASWTMTPGAAAAPGGYMGNSLLADAEKARAAGDIATAQRLYDQVAKTSPDPNQKQYALNVLASMQQQSPFAPASRTVLSPTTTPTPASNLIMQSPAAWSPYGRLRDIKLQADNGQPLYALEDNQGKTLVYVTNLPGKSLAAFNGRTVTVYGPTMYRSDAVRMQYILASHVSQP